MNFKNILTIIIISLFLTSIAGAYADIEESKTNEDGSSIATIRLIDTAGNTLISYDKKLAKGSSWTIQESNVANRIGHIQSEDGGKVNPSTKGARYVKNGRTYSILGYDTEFPVKVTATGEDYTRDIILNVEPVDCIVTLTYVDNVTGEIIRSTSNNILKGDSWTVDQSQFDNVVSNRINITVDDRNYTFVDFNTSAPLVMEWAPEDYEVIVCLNYDEIILPPEPVPDDDPVDDNSTDENSTDNETVDNETIENETVVDNSTDDEIDNITPTVDNSTTNEDKYQNNQTSTQDNESNPIIEKNNNTTYILNNTNTPKEPIYETGNGISLLCIGLLLIAGIFVIQIRRG